MRSGRGENLNLNRFDARETLRETQIEGLKIRDIAAYPFVTCVYFLVLFGIVIVVNGRFRMFIVGGLDALRIMRIVVVVVTLRRAGVFFRKVLNDVPRSLDGRVRNPAIRRVRQSEHCICIRQHRGSLLNSFKLFITLRRMFEADDIGKRRIQRYGYSAALNHDTKLYNSMHMLRRHAGGSQGTDRHSVRERPEYCIMRAHAAAGTTGKGRH